MARTFRVSRPCDLPRLQSGICAARVAPHDPPLRRTISSALPRRRLPRQPARYRQQRRGADGAERPHAERPHAERSHAERPHAERRCALHRHRRSDARAPPDQPSRQRRRSRHQHRQHRRHGRRAPHRLHAHRRWRQRRRRLCRHHHAGHLRQHRRSDRRHDGRRQHLHRGGERDRRSRGPALHPPRLPPVRPRRRRQLCRRRLRAVLGVRVRQHHAAHHRLRSGR